MCAISWAACPKCMFVFPRPLVQCQSCGHPLPTLSGRPVQTGPAHDTLWYTLWFGDGVARSLQLAEVAREYGDGFAAYLRGQLNVCEEAVALEHQVRQSAREAKAATIH
jgi:hypothetical protein